VGTFAAQDATAPVPVDVELHAPAPVVGGTPAAEGRWPDAVALFVDDQFFCSGVLVAPDLVLTAGHCGFGVDYALVGTADTASGGQAIDVVEFVVHDDPLGTLDVAAMRLAHPAYGIEPRAIARDCVLAEDLFPGAPVQIVGFGAIDPWAEEWTTQLHEAQTTVLDPACVDFDAGCNEDVSPGAELIAGGGGVDSCLGDSGGPLYLLGSHGDLLVGITSRGVWGADTPCGGGGIYVRADAVAEWVEETVGVELPRPVCDGNAAPRPTADPIEVVAGGSAQVTVDPGDADGWQGHAFAVAVPPLHGAASVDAAGVVTYDAAGAPVGHDALTVEVTDDGDPPMTGLVEVPIEVVAATVPDPPAPRPPPQGCGCAETTAPTGSFGVLAVIFLRRRR
jgi:hypothetical protein